MNVGIDIRPLLEKERSGVGEYAHQLLNAIFNTDRENQYFLFYNSWKKIDDLLPVEWEKFSNVHFCGFHWPNKLLNFCFKFLGWPKTDKLIMPAGKVDLFFIPNLNFVALSRGVKKIITVHDLSFERYPKFFSRKRLMWHWFVSPRKLVHGVDLVIAVSENTKKDLTELYKVKPEKIGVIYSGVEQELRIENRESRIEEVKKKYNLPDNFILFLGTFEPRKNIEDLIRAFEILRKSFKFSAQGGSVSDGQVTSLKLVIVGPKGWLWKRILKRAQISPFHDDIKFINYISPEEKIVFYKLAKLFVYPSFYEGFGFPPLEAATAGTPAIVSTASSLPEIMGGAALLVDPYNPAEIAKVMAECLVNENLKNRLIKRGKAQAEKFSWQKCAEGVLTIFRQMKG
jgi:glycosyltransferase involved in cell wall biosynthesis